MSGNKGGTAGVNALSSQGTGAFCFNKDGADDRENLPLRCIHQGI